MVELPHGSTYGDAIIVFEGFAEHHPWRFVFTNGTILGGLLVTWYIVGFIAVGPIGRHKRRFDRARTEARKTDQPRLPL